MKSLGSGADFVAFQDHLGLPTLSIEFNATGGYTYGAYHSNYDTRWFAEHVADPGFRRGAQLVRVLGSVALRLGESEVLPIRFSHYAQRLAEFVDSVSTWTFDDDGRRTVALDLRPLESAVSRIAAAASALERQIDEGLASGRLPSPATPDLNDVLARLEQRLLDESEPSDRQSVPARDLRLGYLFAVRRAAVPAACGSRSCARRRARRRGSRAHRCGTRAPRPGTS